MIEIKIPGNCTLHLEHLVLDFNGTLARDGILLPDVTERIHELADLLTVHIVTADTFGHCHRQVKGLPVTLAVIEETDQALQKQKYVEKLGADSTVAIGNGSNDANMLGSAALGICIVGGEGASVKAMTASDVLVTGIRPALELLVCPKRLAATLRE